MEIFFHGYILEDVDKSTSGGAAQAISRMLLDDDFVIYGVSYSNDFKSSQYSRVDSIGQLESLRGTKYIYPKIDNALFLIDNDIKSRKKIVVFGLPCFVSFLKNKYSNDVFFTEECVLIDLICHGPMAAEVHEAYINMIEKKYKTRLTFLNTRDKEKGWNNPSLSIQFANGKKLYLDFNSSIYHKCFQFGTMKGCFECKYKGTNRSSDITLGDYWGISNNDDGFNSMGNSVLIPHSRKGENIIKRLNRYMALFDGKHDVLERNNPYYFCSVKETPEHIRFRQSFKKNGLKRTLRKMMTFRERIKLIVPTSIRDFVKKYFLRH